MIVPAEHAFRILDHYRTSGMRLAFGGKILGEEAACAATVQHVWPETGSVGLKLWSDYSAQTWDRLIPLKHATFSLAQIGDPEFEVSARWGFTRFSGSVSLMERPCSWRRAPSAPEGDSEREFHRPMGQRGRYLKIAGPPHLEGSSIPKGTLCNVG
jgi:hypothetical protein